MKAIILVGGEGTRLRPLTYESPKQMLPIVGTPMLEWVLGNLARHGITDVVLSMGYLPNRFTEAYPSNVVAGIDVTYVVEPRPLDTAGAIRFAALEAGVDDTFMVVNGDVVSDTDLSALISFHYQRGGVATIGTHPVEDPSSFGVVPTFADGRVLAFVEKPLRTQATSNMINAGVYILEPSVLDYIDPGVRVSIEKVTFPRLVAENLLYALSDSSYWLDAGTPENFLQASLDILSGRRAMSLMPQLRDGSWFGESSDVDPSATVACSAIDRNCRIGKNAVIRNSVLMPGVVVEAGAVVRNSILGPNALVGSGAQLGATCVVGGGERVPNGYIHSGGVRIDGA